MLFKLLTVFVMQCHDDTCSRVCCVCACVCVSSFFHVSVTAGKSHILYLVLVLCTYRCPSGTESRIVPQTTKALWDTQFPTGGSLYVLM